MRTQDLIFYLIALLALLALTSGKPIKTNENEVIIIGKILINAEKKLNTENISIRFVNETKGDETCKVNADGFFVTKIDKDNSFIDYIEYKKDGKYRKRFTDNCATLHLPKGQAIYYIGDIKLDWTPSKDDRIRKAFSVSVGVGGVESHEGDISVQSSYKPEEACHDITISQSTDAINWYKQKFPKDNRKIETKLINVL